jgi:hypothetical protein
LDFSIGSGNACNTHGFAGVKPELEKDVWTTGRFAVLLVGREEIHVTPPDQKNRIAIRVSKKKCIPQEKNKQTCI